MMGFLASFIESVWVWFTKKIVPWLSEKLNPTFSASEEKWRQSTVVASRQLDGTTLIHVDAFFSVTNHTSRELCLTGAYLKKPMWGEVKTFRSFPEYIPAHKTLRLHAVIFIQKLTHYQLQGEYIKVVLYLESSNSRSKSVEITLKNNN